MSKVKHTRSKSDAVVIKWLYNLCSGQKWTILFLVVINIIYATFSVFFAGFSKKVIDAATVDNDLNEVIKYGIAMFGVVLLQMIFSMGSSAVSERCSGRIEIILKDRILDLAITKDFSAVTGYHTGELQNRMFNDANLVASTFTNILPDTVFFITKLVCAIAYLVILDRAFAMIFVVGGVLIYFITMFFRRKSKALHKAVQETEGKTRSFVQEMLSNLLAVKAFSVDEKIKDRADDLQENNFKAKMRKRNFSIFANASLGGVFNVASVLAVVFGAWRLLNGVMTYGDVTAMIQLVNQIKSPLNSLSSVMPKYFSMLASAERIMELENMPDEKVFNEKEISPQETYSELQAIHFNNISFKYDRDIILDNTSLSVKKGDFVAIMGISGIGKSTLLKLLLGVFNVNSGEIVLKTTHGNIPVDKYTRRLFSYVPQGNMLISGTIRDNLTFINDNVTESEIERAIEISCSKQFIDELPLGLDTVIGEKGIGLSEGQVQRLAIARSLLSKSPILLLDEATSALDEATEKQFLTNLKSLDNMTCIIVSHKKAALEICNKRIKIQNCKIISEEY
ncbi:MAG: ABC transporter ATP-binding protein/permease [Clostridiales bacterium]|nr:ABC transporter ATP-binding protein/permease [Clostridiales bacterium]